MIVLKKPGFPIVFHGVLCQHRRDGPSHSLFNRSELDKVRDYVKKFTDEGVKRSQIGIISPYKKQVIMSRFFK